MTADSSSMLFLRRSSVLIAELRDGPLARPDLLERLRLAYPQTTSARVMVDRDVRRLAALGVDIEISQTRTPI